MADRVAAAFAHIDACPICSTRVLCVAGQKLVDAAFAEAEKTGLITVCPPPCDAGGTEADGGHVFNIDVEEANASYYKCRCGMSNMAWHAYWMP